MKDRTRLNKLLDKTFIYKQEHITVKDFFEDVDTNTVKIVTTGKTITVKQKDLPAFLDSLLPVASETTQAIVQVDKETSGLLKTLQETLLDNIAQVKANPGYIKQATTINSSVNALVGLAKIQIQAARLKGGK